MPSLAPELVLQILEAAYQPSSASVHPDTATLSSAALVCTAWAPLAQQVLFREVVLLRTPEPTPPVARATPGVLLASSQPPHALREARPDVTPRVSRAARLRALAAAATPAAPAPRSHRSSQAFASALEIDRAWPSARAQSLALLVRAIHVFITQPRHPCPHFDTICPDSCCAPSSGALTERHLAVLLGRLPYLTSAHIVLDCVDGFSSAVMNTLRQTSNITTLGLHVLKRPLSIHSLFNPNNAIGSSPRTQDEPDTHAAVFQLVRALAPNLDTLILDGELPRDPPVSPLASSSPVEANPRPSLKGNRTVASEPAPDCSLRALIWRGKLPPSPALLTWLLSVKAKGRAELSRSQQKPSRLEVLELCYLPPPDALAELLREHVPTLRSLRLHYFDSEHVNVVREILRPTLSELVLNKPCTATPDLLSGIRAQHVAVTQPCVNTVKALENAGSRGFRRVTVVDGERAVSERVRAACEAEGVVFESVRALGQSLIF